MKTFLIYYTDQWGYPDDVVIKAYNEHEAIIKFYSEFPSQCRIKSIQ
jgi:hypothetical protein